MLLQNGNVDKYEVTELGRTCAEIVKTAVVHEARCKEAADIVANGQFSFITSGSNRDPKCYLDTHGFVNWNPHKTGGKHLNDREICLKTG